MRLRGVGLEVAELRLGASALLVPGLRGRKTSGERRGLRTEPSRAGLLPGRPRLTRPIRPMPSPPRGPLCCLLPALRFSLPAPARGSLRRRGPMTSPGGHAHQMMDGNLGGVPMETPGACFYGNRGGAAWASGTRIEGSNPVSAFFLHLGDFESHFSHSKALKESCSEDGNHVPPNTGIKRRDVCTGTRHFGSNREGGSTWHLGIWAPSS